MSNCVVVDSDIQIRKLKNSQYYESPSKESSTITTRNKTVLQDRISLDDLQEIEGDKNGSFIISLVDQASQTYSEIHSVMLSNDSMLLNLIIKDKSENTADSFQILLDRKNIDNSVLNKSASGYQISKTIRRIDENDNISGPDFDSLPGNLYLPWNNQLYIKDFDGFIIDSDILHLYSGTISLSPDGEGETKFVVINDVSDPDYVQDAFPIYFLFKNNTENINEECRKRLKAQCKKKQLFLQPHKSEEGWIRTTIRCYGACID